MHRRDLLKSLAATATTLGALETGFCADSPDSGRLGRPIEQDGLLLWSETSLNRVFPNSAVGSAERLDLVTPRNAQLSFQLCLRNEYDYSLRVRATVETPPGWTILVRRVGYVPMANLDTDIPVDELDGVGHIPGYVPDPLYPEPTAHVGPSSNASFWVTVRIPADATPGIVDLKCEIAVEEKFQFPAFSKVTPQSAQLPVRIDVRPLVLQRRKDFAATHWISADSIWEYYKTPPFSERFWELAESYIANLTAHNLNVVYCPIFNARHEVLERPAQLLKVRSTGADQFEFDFSDVRRWIRIARRHGAEFLEWTHFFTPAPTSGKHPQRIFERWEKLGKLLWAPEISAVSTTYRRFLEQFLPPFKRVLEEEGVLECSLFHCADEPDGDVQMADYRKARGLLKELAPWLKVIDAMSDPRFATEGLTDMPIPSIATAPLFADAKCPAWVYFCCGPRGRFLQRFLDTPLPKLRMAGWLFYKLNARGFLHWGHNYWFVFCTGTILNPFLDASTAAWPGMPYGDAFVVYPGENGPIDSIRWEVFAESLQDYALLQTARIERDDPLLAELKTYEIFPKEEQWLEEAIRRILARNAT
jgi:hypothetical protein